jgi:hypothetical protein
MLLRRVSPKAIAAVLSGSLSRVVTVEMVESDIEWIRQQHLRNYGPASAIDPAVEIGNAIDAFAEMEHQSLLEFHALKQEAANRRLSPMFVARARKEWLKTAGMFRVLRVKMLAEQGLLSPSQSSKTPEGAVARADDIRALLRNEGLLAEVAAAAEAMGKPALASVDAELTSDEDDEEREISAWLDDGGGLFGREFE